MSIDGQKVDHMFDSDMQLPDQVWELITDKNVQYVVQATLNLAAIPILCYMVTRANTVILKTYIVLFG